MTHINHPPQTKTIPNAHVFMSTKGFDTKHPDERLVALARLLGRSAAARDHALQLKIEEAAENICRKETPD